MHIVTAILLCLATGDAIADDEPARVLPHINVGGEHLVDDNVKSTSFRLHALASRAFGSAARRPMAALGFTVGIGSLQMSDEMPRDLVTFGLELQVGLRFVDGGFLDNRIYASVAANQVSLEQYSGAAPSRIGYRFAIGANWIDATAKKLDGSSYGDEVGTLFALVFPHQLELVWDRSVDSNRLGVAVSYGL